LVNLPRVYLPQSSYLDYDLNHFVKPTINCITTNNYQLTTNDKNIHSQTKRGCA
jgi:hypothetical protein